MTFYHSELITTASLNDYWQLLKPRVMSLVIFTGWCGMVLAPGKLHPVLQLTAILAIAAGAGGSGCLNMWVERYRDSLMKRTCNRPLPAGLVHPDSALSLGIILSVGSILLMVLVINQVAAFWLGFTIVFYVFIYTVYLKPRTDQNIVIGGIAGALPPVIGWACVSGETNLIAWSLFLIIFLWTPAHFWALCLECGQDYVNAGIPMLTQTKGETATKNQILLYTFLTICSSYGPYALGVEKTGYLIMITILGTVFIGLAVTLKAGRLKPLKLFFFSMFYLLLVFLSLVVFEK
jgi:protoheme IX farnesyltransferase